MNNRPSSVMFILLYNIQVCDKWQDLETNFLEYDVLNSGVVSFQSFKGVEDFSLFMTSRLLFSSIVFTTFS